MLAAEAKQESRKVVELPVGLRKQASVIAYANDYLLMMYVALASRDRGRLIAAPA